MRISDWSSDVCSSDLQHLQSSDVVARRGFGIGDEATVMQFLRRGVRPLAEIEEAAHQAGSAGCGAGANRSTTKPAHADTIDPASTPSLTSFSTSPRNASPPMNRLIVKPIPHKSATP